jgi:hypothetical protein
VGGIYLDAEGRDASRHIGLLRNRISVGSPRERVDVYIAYSTISGLGRARNFRALAKLTAARTPSTDFTANARTMIIGEQRRLLRIHADNAPA